MSTKSYVINFTDPAKSTITIPAGDSFGPYSNTRFTDIELVGMGHTFWGEKINENILHMLENFASNEDLHLIAAVPSATTFVVAGRDVTKSFVASVGSPANTIEIVGSNSNDGTYPVVSSTFDGTNTTITIIGSLNTTTPLGSAGEAGVPDKSSDFSPVSAITGQLWYNQTTGKILVFSQTGSPLIAGGGDWKPLNEFTISATQPSGATDGNLWWDTSITDGRNLKIYISGTWEIVVPDMLPRDGSKPMAGVLDMGNNNITNVALSTSGADAISRNEADSRYFNVTGDTITGTLSVSGQTTLSAPLDMQSNNITNVLPPTTSSDAIPRSYADNTYVNVIGDSMSGPLDMSGSKIISIGNASAGTDALNLATADTLYVNSAGDTMTGSLTLSADPVNNLHAATKQYVDNNTAGGITTITNPIDYSLSLTTGKSAWQTISAPAGATSVMIVADCNHIVYSSGISSFKIYARNPTGTTGDATDIWKFVEVGSDWPNAGSSFFTATGSTIVGVSTSGTIQMLANISNSGIVAPSASYRIVAWW